MRTARKRREGFPLPSPPAPYGFSSSIRLVFKLTCLCKFNLGVSSDLFSDLQELRLQIHNKLDPAIRRCLQKRGIIIHQNIQTGFDTEFVRKGMLENKLLSSQLAINTQTYLRIPKVIPFGIFDVNPLTSNEC